MDTKLQLMLDKARAVDLEILEQYREKEVVIRTPRSNVYGGIITEVGSEFIYVTDFKEYKKWPLEKSRENIKIFFNKIPDRTLSRSQIEEIFLLEDVGKQGRKIKC